MKKLFFIPLTLLVFACSSDDDNSTPIPTTAEDQLTGTWKHSAYFVDNIDNLLDPCETEETLVFGADGSYTREVFEEINNGICILESVESGTWENVGNNNYMITIDGDSNVGEFFFESNSFYLEYVNDYGSPNDTSDDVVEKYVYTKQ